MTHVRVGAAAGAVAAILSTLGLGAAAADAEPAFHCEATALRVSVAGGAPVEPVVAGRDGACATAVAPPSLALPAPLEAQALLASTSLDAPGAAGAADGGVAHLRVLPTPDLVAALPTEQAIDALPRITIPLPLALPPLPPSVDLDVREAVRALVPAPGAALLGADVLNAHAGVACRGGVAALSGASRVAGVTLLGQDVGVDGVVSQALTLIDTQHIAPSSLDLGKVTFYGPLGPIAGPLLALVQDAVKAPLAALPPIELPASVLDARLVPGEQIADGATLTQRALRASLLIAGRPILDAVLGEAKVGAADGACASPPPAAPGPASAAKPAAKAPSAGVAAQGGVADQILACSDRKLVLVDVLERGDHVTLLGAANRAYAGRRVAIRLRATGRVVAHATVRRDGSFATSAPRPPRALLATHRRANAVRYRAEIGRETSLPLKLRRRLVVSSLTSHAGRVTIAGRVVRPLTTPVSEVRVVRRVSCHRVVLVNRFKPRSDGTFRVTVKAPRGQAAAVYRLVTRVREKPSNPRTYPTFTLPRGVALNTR